MKTGKVILGGIRYRLDFHEGMATFVEFDRMSCARITVQKSSPHDLLYVQATSATGFVPYSHVRKAAAVCESLFGPNHYASLKAMHHNERNIAARHIWSRPIFRVKQRLFWSHDIPFRVASVWRALQHQLRLLMPERKPRIDWMATTSN